MTQTDALPVNEIPNGSIDYIGGTVTDSNGNPLAMTVDIAVTPAWDTDATHTWLPASWIGAAGATRQCQTVNPVNTAALTGGSDGARYGVYVRLTNTPALPIIQVGWIVLTA
jgi:hypothetical protein